MPRTKESRNPLGSIFKRRAVRFGKMVDVWDVRKRTAQTDADGKPLKNEKGKTLYKDKTKRCYSYAEAVIALGNLPVQIKEEAEREKEKITHENTLSELIDYFKSEYVKSAVYSGNRKIAGYKQDIKTITRNLDEFTSYFGEISVRSLTYEMIRSFSEYLASTPTKKGTLPAAATVHKKLTLLNRILNVAIQKNWLDFNPMRRGKNLIEKSAEGERNRMLTFEEEARLLAQCEDFDKRRNKRRHLKTYILLSLDTGMRRGEVFNLRWWQIDFKKKVIYLTKEAAKQTKTGVAGILPLTDRLSEELKFVRANSVSTGENDLVVGKTEIKRSFATACDLAGIKDFQYRDLRATAATRMLLAGNVGELVRKITRHTRTETFLNHYTAIDALNARAVGEKLQEFNRRETAKAKRKTSPKKTTKVEVKGKAKIKASA